MENTHKILKQHDEKSRSKSIVLQKEELVELGKATQLTQGRGHYGYESNNRQMHDQEPKYYC